MISGLKIFGSGLWRTLRKSFGHFSENASESPNIVRKSFILLEANLRYYSENHNNINSIWCVSSLGSGTGDTTENKTQVIDCQILGLIFCLQLFKFESILKATSHSF